MNEEKCCGYTLEETKRRVRVRFRLLLVFAVIGAATAILFPVESNLRMWIFIVLAFATMSLNVDWRRAVEEGRRRRRR